MPATPQTSGNSIAALSQPSCGQCGYCVRGLEKLICPECGSDLREVGIVTPNRRSSLTKIQKGILWTLILPLPAGLISWGLIMTVLPFTLNQKFTRPIVCQSPALTTTIQVFGTRRLWQPPLLSRPTTPPEKLILVDQQHHIFMDVNLNTGAFTYNQANNSLSQHAGGFNAGVLLNWFATAGVNTKDQNVIEMCNAIYLALMEIPSPTHGTNFTPLLDRNGKQVGMAQGGGSFVVHDEPSAGVIIALGFFWLAVWIYGLRRISRQVPSSPLSR